MLLQKDCFGEGKGKADAVCWHLLFAAQAAQQLCLHLQGQTPDFLPHSFVLFCFTAFKGMSALSSFSPFLFLTLLLQPVTNSAKARPRYPSPAVEALPPLLPPEAAPAAPLPCSLAGSPGSVHLQGSAAPSLVLGSSVPDYPAVSPSVWLLRVRVHQVRQRLGAVLQVPQYFVGSQPPNPKQVAEPRCHSSAMWPHGPHACAWQVSQRCWAMGQQLPKQAPSSPRYSSSLQLLSLGQPDLNCGRSFLFLSVREKWRNNVL